METEVSEAQKNGRKDDEALLAALLALGEKRATDEDLTRQGKKLILPEGWDERRAIDFLTTRLQAQESVTEFGRTFKYRPWDGAHAVQSALGRVFGQAGTARPVMSFFGVERPELRSVHIGVDDTVQVPWGTMDVPLLEGTLTTGAIDDPEYGLLFRLGVEAPRKHKAHVEAFFEVVAQELKERSIYKGKAINGAAEPEFIDLRGFDSNKVVYSQQVWTELAAHVWSLLRHPQAMRDAGLPLKRAVLFDGGFGVGKTLAAKMTAMIGVENGWTVLYCRPGRDDLFTTMQTARLYQPAAIIVEDIDALASSGDRDATSKLLDLFDGITAKDTEMVCVLTTNNKESIVKGMLRPGRLDALISFGALDAEGVEQMAYSVIGEDDLEPAIDWAEVHEAMEGYSPAFVREAIDRSVRYAMVEGDARVIREVDLVNAAKGLREHFSLQQGAGSGELPPSLEKGIEAAVESALDGTEVLRGDAAFGRLKP